MSASATCQITWTITEEQLNNNIRLVHDHEAALITIHELVERNAVCDKLVHELEIERTEAQEVIESCQSYARSLDSHIQSLNATNTALRKDNAKKDKKIKRSRLFFGISGVIVGGVGGYFVGRMIK
jgi:SMC interacting uncharacterized protein involved in chromosome segregation